MPVHSARTSATDSSLTSLNRSTPSARHSLTLAAAIHQACPWPEHLIGLGISPDCTTYRADWYARVIPQFDPDIVVLANRPYDAPGNALPINVSGHNGMTVSPVAHDLGCPVDFGARPDGVHYADGG